MRVSKPGAASFDHMNTSITSRNWLSGCQATQVISMNCSAVRTSSFEHIECCRSLVVLLISHKIQHSVLVPPWSNRWIPVLFGRPASPPPPLPRPSITCTSTTTTTTSAGASITTATTTTTTTATSTTLVDHLGTIPRLFQDYSRNTHPISIFQSIQNSHHPG